MANVPRGAPKGKKSFEVFEDATVDDLTVSTGLTLGTTDALTVDTIVAIAGKELNIAGSSTLDVEVKLGDAAGVTDFHVADSAGVELFKVPSTGIIALEGGATIDNSTSATTLKFTETNISLVGATDVDGALTAGSVTSDAAITATTRVVGTTGVTTQHGSGADILIATLTTAFGDPAAIANGTMFSYYDTVATKAYLVTVVGGAFYLEELTAAASE